MRQNTPETNTDRYDLTLLHAVGQDVVISKNVEIRRPHMVSIGSHVAIDSGFYLTTAAEIGDYTHLGPYITVIGGEQSMLIVGNFATIAAGSRIICGSDTFSGEGFTSVTVPEQYRDRVRLTTITVGAFCGVGTNAVLMPGVTLGEGSVIGACSLVMHDTEPWTVYTGIPARPLKMRPRERMLKYAKELGC